MSFSQEMKDFIGAYEKGQKINASRTDQDYKEAQTESTKKKTERDNDPETLAIAGEQAKATLARTQDALKTAASGRASAAASRENTAAMTALRREQLRQMQLQQQQGSGLFPGSGAIQPGGTMQPAPVTPGGGALPIGPSTLDDQTEMYADGGLVPEDEEEEDAGVLPVEQPAAAPTDVSARARQPAGVPKGLEGVISPALVADATKAGMKFGINQYGLGGGAVATPRAQANARLFAQGHGGLTEQEMEAARKAVDPEGKLTDSQRNMAALGSVYQFWANKGEGQKAEKVAFQMLQHYRNASQRYAAIAAKAAEGGNVDLAMKAAMKAYANVPDGNDLELLPNPDGGIMYAVTGPNGDVVTKGIATPQQLAASAMGLATGGFDKAILSAAGAREDTGAVKTGGAGKTQTAGDRAKEAELPAKFVDDMKTKWIEKNKDKPVDEGYWGEMADTAQHLLQQNPKATGREAANAAMALITPGKADPEKPDFKVIPGEEGKPNTIKFGSGRKFEVDDSQLEVIMNARAARVKAAVDAINQKMEDEDKPGLLDKVGAAAKTAGGALAGIASDAAPAVATMGRIARDTAVGAIPDEMRERVGSDVPRIGAMIADKFRSPRGAIPVDDNDRPL